jgi:hypothetical protein
MDVNFMKMHNLNNPAAAFKGNHLGNYSDAQMELDDNIKRITEVVRQVAPNNCYPDCGQWCLAGCLPDAERPSGEKKDHP